MKRILDYTGEVSYRYDFAIFWLEDNITRGGDIACDLDDALVRALGTEGVDWRGRLHILVELEEESD